MMEMVRVSFDDDDCVNQLTDALRDIPWHETTIACVGTDRSTGDSLGPLIGTRLQQLLGTRIPIMGTLDDPLHAVNLSDRLEREVHTPYIFAIDSCLGSFNHVGHIFVEDRPLRPGAGVKKKLPEFGDWTLEGVVNVSGFMEYLVLQNTRLSIVMRMADVIASALYVSITANKPVEMVV